MDEVMEMTPGHFELGERLDVAEAGALAKELTEFLEKAKTDIEIGLGRVRIVDTAGVQLMIAFAREAQKRGRMVRFGELSDAFSEAARLLGVAKEFATPCRSA